MLAWLTHACLSRPRIASLVLLAVLATAALPLPRLRTEFGYRPLLGDAHPTLVTLDRFIDQFGGGFPVTIAWSCAPPAPCANPLDADSLAMAATLSRELAESPAIRSVSGPANASLLVPAPEGFAIRRLVESGRPVPDRAELAERVLRDPLWSNRLISADGQVAAVIVQTRDSESATSEIAMGAIFRALAPHEARGYEFQLVGHPVEFVVAGRELARSSAALTPLTLAVLALVLLLLTRSPQAVAATLLMLGSAVLATFGLLAALDWPQDAIIQTLAPLILITGVCDAMHLLARYAALRSGSSRAQRRNALASAAASVARPCALTSLTTGAAFLSFATSDLATFWRFGVVASFGVAACLVLTFTLLPLLLVWLPAEGPRGLRTSEAWAHVLGAIAEVSVRRAGPILVASALLFGVAAVGWGLFLRVDTDGYEMYGEGSRVVRWIRFVERHLARADTLELALTLPDGVPLAAPEALGGIGALGAQLEALDGLGPATSVAEMVAWLNRILHDDDPAADRLPETFSGNAELLELLAFEDPALLEPWVTFDQTTVRISVAARFQSAHEREAVLDAARKLAERLLPPGSEILLTGPYAVGHDWVQDVQATQWRSFATALAAVFAVLLATQRSLRGAAFALVPTVLPAVGVLGAMGWLGLSLDVGRTMIAAVIVGIGVDDTLHLLDRHDALRCAGEGPEDAVRGALLFVGRPVVTTSLALALGFLSLMGSAWQTVSSFGFFVALGIALALAAVLFVLPALMVRERTR